MADQFPELVIIQGTGSGQRFVLDHKRTRIGRSNENEIIINDRLSSRVHSIIRELDGVYYLSDMDSRNGTKLNGNDIKEEELQDGDEIQIGNIVFRFQLEKSKAEISDVREFSEDDFASVEDEYETTTDKGVDWKSFLIIPVVLLVILFVYYLYSTQQVKEPPPPPIPLPAQFSYGFLPNGDQKHADHVTYTFEYKSGNLELTYKVWDVDEDGEVNIYLNNTKLYEVERTQSGHWSGRRILKLPDELVHRDKLNFIIFDNPKNPPRQLMWGVAEVDVLPEVQFECETQKAKTAYELGKKSYEDKLVVKSNLYRAIEKFQTADSFLKNCPEKPDFYFDNKLKLDEATRELNNKYKNHLFEYNKNKKLGRFQQAAIELRFLKELIPNPEDERHIKIKREERYLQRALSRRK
ncbi:FHA domain-containing protein [candidate division CSSED10-310 bacterium]|uniref:FHA domain-containing protein n=1 Tax=candidate division CSSED10-310 bacterium TaxID=2855610 RepID=A0ABV6YXQ7_UNCC1